MFFHVACTRAHIIGEHPFGAKRQIASRLFLKIVEIFLRGPREPASPMPATAQSAISVLKPNGCRLQFPRTRPACNHKERTAGYTNIPDRGVPSTFTRLRNSPKTPHLPNVLGRFESLAVALRPLQRRPRRNNLSFNHELRRFSPATAGKLSRQAWQAKSGCRMTKEWGLLRSQVFRKFVEKPQPAFV